MTFKQPGFSLHAGTSPAKAKLTEATKKPTDPKPKMGGGEKGAKEAVRQQLLGPRDKSLMGAVKRGRDKQVDDLKAKLKSRKKGRDTRAEMKAAAATPAKAASPKRKADENTKVSKKRAGLFKRGQETTTNYNYDDKGELSSSSSKTRQTRSLAGRIFKKGKYTGSGSTGRTKYKDGKPVIRTSGTFRTRKK